MRNECCPAAARSLIDRLGRRQAEQAVIGAANAVYDSAVLVHEGEGNVHTCANCTKHDACEVRHVWGILNKFRAPYPDARDCREYTAKAGDTP